MNPLPNPRSEWTTPTNSEAIWLLAVRWALRLWNTRSTCDLYVLAFEGCIGKQIITQVKWRSRRVKASLKPTLAENYSASEIRCKGPWNKSPISQGKAWLADNSGVYSGDARRILPGITPLAQTLRIMIYLKRRWICRLGKAPWSCWLGMIRDTRSLTRLGGQTALSPVVIQRPHHFSGVGKEGFQPCRGQRNIADLLSDAAFHIRGSPHCCGRQNAKGFICRSQHGPARFVLRV